MLTLSVLCLGTLGVALRFLLDSVIRSSHYPLSTFLVNLFGCFVAGWLMTTSTFSAESKTSALIGFCGGLTTFSALIIQSLQMIREGDWVKAVGYLMISQLAGLFAAWVGMKSGEA